MAEVGNSVSPSVEEGAAEGVTGGWVGRKEGGGLVAKQENDTFI